MKNINSIQWKLVAIYNVIVLISMISSGIFILWQLEKYEYSKIENDLEAVTSSFMSVKFEDDSDQTIVQTFKQYLEKNTSFYTDKNTEVYLLDNKGTYIASTVLKKVENFDHRFIKSSIMSAMNGISKFEKLEELDENESRRKIMAYACPVKIDKDVKLIIYTRMYIDNVEETMEKARTIILLSTFLALLISVITGFIFSKTLTDPIKTLTDTAKKMASGQIYQSIEVQSDDEIGQLTRTFNSMSVELNRTLSSITNEKNKLETVFEHMQDGIIAFNTYGEVIHSNKAFLNILDRKRKISRLSELNKLLGIEISLVKITKLRTSSLKTYEITYNKKVINTVIVNYLNDKKITEGIIIMLQDVTEQRKLDNMRREFVANVSHELRTPLTTVKGYVETLLENNVDDVMKQKFLNVINNETDRMTLLVQDLLELSRFDNSQIKLNKQIVDIYSLVKDVCFAQRIQIKEKHQNLKINLPEEEKILKIDPHRISQVVTNILSNAIKYSEENASIEVSSKVGEKSLQIIIKDTGIGIPKDDLSRVFERFYRVDKARSRAMGGTGLGLAIAKEIMQAHNGDIKIESEYTKGTTVKIIFSIL